MRLDEIDEVRARLDQEAKWTAYDSDHAYDWVAEDRRLLDRDEGIFAREAAAHAQEQSIIVGGGPPPVYAIRIASTLPRRSWPDEMVACPEAGCGADEHLVLCALGDASHRSWVVCPAGHEWEEKDVTYDVVRLLVDQAANASRALAVDAPPVPLNWFSIYDTAGTEYTEVPQPPEDADDLSTR